MSRRFRLAFLCGAACLSAAVAAAAAGAFQASGNADEPRPTPDTAPASALPSPLPPEQEEAVLRHALTYLKLSRRQVGGLLARARQTDGFLAMLRREEAETARALERLAGRAPEREARLREIDAARRADADAQLIAFAKTQLLRLLTREQIGLAWRLTVGRPPQQAGADPVLLEEASGFVRPPDQEPPYPFPQRLAESMDPDELAPTIEPFGRRLFTSSRFVHVLEQALARGLPRVEAPGSQEAPLRSLRLLRNYRLDLDLSDRTGRSPDLEPLGGRLLNGLYEFGAGEGLSVTDLGVTDQYTLQIDFRFQHHNASFQKLLDFKDGAVDGGLYLHRGEVLFCTTPWKGGGGGLPPYVLGTGGDPEPGRIHRLRLERDRSRRIVRALLDSRPIFAFVDLDDDAVFAERAGLLFVDDRATQHEQGPGAVGSLLVWGRP